YLQAFLVPQVYNSVGQIIAGSTGNPGTNRYVGRAIDLNAANTTNDLHDLRFRNVDKAITLTGSGLTYTLSHSQISLANIGFYNLNAEPTGFIRNVLAYDLLTGFSMGSSTNARNACEHVTFHRVKDFRNSTNVGAMSI